MLKLFMTKNSKMIEQVMLAAIIGVASIGVSFIGEMSQTIQTMSISVQELNVKVSGAFDSLKDHELRLRTIESNKRK